MYAKVQVLVAAAMAPNVGFVSLFHTSFISLNKMVYDVILLFMTLYSQHAFACLVFHVIGRKWHVSVVIREHKKSARISSQYEIFFSHAKSTEVDGASK